MKGLDGFEYQEHDTGLEATMQEAQDGLVISELLRTEGKTEENIRCFLAGMKYILGMLDIVVADIAAGGKSD